MPDYLPTEHETQAMIGAILGIGIGLLAITGLTVLLMAFTHNPNTTPEKPQCQCACMK